jgi:hypothetical protein
LHPGIFRTAPSRALTWHFGRDHVVLCLTVGATDLHPVPVRHPDPLVISWQGRPVRVRHDDPRLGPYTPTGARNAGDAITQLDTMNVLPFLNMVVVIQDLSAEDLAATLQVACESRGGGGFMQPAAISYTCDYTGESIALRDVVIDAGDGSSVTLVDSEGVVDASVGPIDVITNSFTARGGDGYDAFGAAEKVSLRSDDDAQIHYERSFREYLQSFPAGEDGVPVISADNAAYANEMGDGRITLIDG